MGGSSNTSISNWGGIESPFTNSLTSYYGAIQANANQYASVAEARDKDWLTEYTTTRENQEAKYDDWIANQEKWQLVETGLGAVQQLVGITLATLQYNAAREALDHQISVWETEKEWADRYQSLWYNNYRPVEESLLDEIANQPLYEAQYQTVQDRIVPTIRSEFSSAREKANRCFDPTCVGEICKFNKDLAIAEAMAVTSSMDRAYRYEEEREFQRNTQRKDEIYKMVGVGRNYISASLTALNSAASAASTAASINPYASLASGLGNAFGEFRQMAANRRELAGAKILGADAGSTYRSMYGASQTSTHDYRASSIQPITGSSFSPRIK